MHSAVDSARFVGIALPSEAEQLVGVGTFMITATNNSEEVVDNNCRAEPCRTIWKLKPAGGASIIRKHLM